MGVGVGMKPCTCDSPCHEEWCESTIELARP